MTTKDYTFHGVAMTQVEFAVAMHKKSTGVCPFCQKAISARYNNANKHLGACTKKPKI
jgi:hypothetical protein